MRRLALVALAALACSAQAQETAKPLAPTETAAATALKPKGRLRLLGAEIPPGTTKRLTWTSGTAMEGFVVPVPVIVLNGKGPGPVLCLTAAVHGDELNGIEVTRRVLDDVDLEELNGAVIYMEIGRASCRERV